jgi:hypothetical protein
MATCSSIALFVNSSLQDNYWCTKYDLFMISEFVPPTGRSIIAKKSDGSQVKESTDSSTTLEDDDVKGKHMMVVPYSITCILLL